MKSYKTLLFDAQVFETFNSRSKSPTRLGLDLAKISYRAPALKYTSVINEGKL